MLPAVCTTALVTLLVLSAPVSHCNGEKLMKLAISWPTSLCNTGTKCKNSPPNRFSVHGLWPLFKGTCGDNNVDWNTFPEATKTRMGTDWGSYSTKTNQQFWDHEWSSHGKCSGLSPSDFFQQGLNLFDKVNLGARLTALGKFPHGQTVTKKDDFPGTISSLANKKLVILLCNKDKAGSVVQLYEIDICFDYDSANKDYADCPKPSPSLKSLCPESFRLTKGASIAAAIESAVPLLLPSQAE
ncbi:ribonuclease S-7-like [Malania oleifera]|uniref:ribonuclease S-7-like n=1 Tax=Malania oleifera TaxID=397392 RepID=UPI0025ADFAED|nr:ribonuclease S-7-like [Malania oleifera]